uniref:Uncharacterized protein n=1 Tax=Arundo donax TaxID=35708 RepID=A0A0A9GVM7_ARUDO
MPLSAQSSSIMWRMVCDSIATASSTSNSSASELLSVITFFSPWADAIGGDAAIETLVASVAVAVADGKREKVGGRDGGSG